MRKAPKAVTTAATSGEAPTGGVKVFTHHGVELHQNQGSDQAMGTCPFCGKENKFYVSVKTTKWKCMSCDEHGNATTFLRNLWEYAREVDTDCSSFLEDRRLLFPETVDAWGVCLSPLTEEWLIPGFTFDKKLNQLYRFVQDPKTGRYRAWATPLPFKHQLHIPDDYDAGKPDVYLCEGFSDGMALWEVLRRAKAVKGEDTLAVTSTESVSFLSKANVLAAPGANVFSDQWAPFFASKRVFLLYDNDHPNKQARTDKPLAPVGYAGMRRVANILSKCETPPKEVHFLRWSEKEGEEHNPDLPSGYDVRDYLTREEEAHNVVALHRGNGMVRTAEVRLRERVHNLQGLLAKLKPIPEDWIDGRGKKATSSGGLELECLPCADWQSLVNSWRKALKWTDGLDVALSVMLAAITSTKAVGDQLWCKVISPPSSGKSVLCEALTVNKRYIIAKSTIRGFHSGYQVDKEGTEDNSLLSKLNGKTLVTKDGDTLLQAPNLGQILSEARDIYDRNSRTHYRNKMSKDYEGFSMTWLLCGTESLRCLDSSELGERFLDVVIVDEMPAEEEREIGHRVRNTALREIALESNGRADSKDRPEIVKSKQLTGGYIDYLRLNASALLPVVAKATSDDMLDRCQDLAEFVSFMRSRPSTRQDEKVQRELSFRLISQMVRLAVCLGVVLGKKEVDEEVMRRVKKVALDTARGRTMRIAQCLYQSGDRGVDPTALSQFTHESREKLNQLLRFLVRIGAAESFRVPTKKGMSARVRWRLTPRVDDLYGRATGEERGDSL